MLSIRNVNIFLYHLQIIFVLNPKRFKQNLFVNNEKQGYTLYEIQFY